MGNDHIQIENWYNKIAVVTGSDHKIGSIIINGLVNKGLIVMGLAINTPNIIKIRSELPTTLRHRLYPIQCDVTKENQVEQAFSWIQNTYGSIDMLVNCAGVLYGEELENAKEDYLSKNLNINIKGIENCTTRVFFNMKNRFAQGHIILMDTFIGDIKSKLASCSRDKIRELSEIHRKQFDAAEGINIELTYITTEKFEAEYKVPNIVQQTLRYSLIKADDISSMMIYALTKSDIHKIIIQYCK